MVSRRRMPGVKVLLAIEVASVAVGPLIAHAAGASTDMVVFAGVAGPVAIWLLTLVALVVFSCVSLLRDSRQVRE